MRKFGLFLTFAIAVTALGPLGAPAADEIRIGALFDLTGPAAWLGVPERNTAQMIVDEINEAGGINGQMIRLIVEDTVGDNTNARNSLTRLVLQEDVLAVIGPSRSGTSMAVKEMASDYEVPLISCAAAEDIVKPVNPWVFKTPQSDSDAVRAIYMDLNREGIDEVAILTAATGFGSAGRDQLRELAPEFGITIISDQTYGAQDTDMTAQLTRIRETGAKAVINWSIVPAQSIVLRNARQLGMDVLLYQSHGFGNIEYVRAAGAAANGVRFPAGRLLIADMLPEDHPQREVLVSYTEAYKERFNEEASTFGGHAYDALWLVVNAIKEVGTDPEAIRAKIENTTGFVGTGGIFNYSEEDHCGLDVTAFEMLTVRDGKFVPLYPE